MEEKKKRSPKQIAALICVIILVSMYIVTLVVAFLDFSDSGRLFAACLVATVGLPILLWIYIWLYGRIKDRRDNAEDGRLED
ncbi:MAG: hypothetical protein J1E98_10275 [Lachnospiraceae bacterium]|nr:hypothetical protein [Lachnospiraceae bacterium]